MKAKQRSFVFVFFFLSLCAVALVCSMPLPARAGGDDNDGAPARPRPDRPKKVYTNDDFGPPSAMQVSGLSPLPAEIKPEPAPSAPRARSQAAPYIREKDFEYYAEQANALDRELARVDADADYLRQFWNNGYAPQTGLILNGPCEGITTDNRIAQLEEHRREIQAQIDALGDTARSNGIAPGVFVHASEIAEAASARTRSAGARRAALGAELDQANAELAETRETEAAMAADTAARNMTLLQPRGEGASFTTDLLDRLNKRATNLEGEIRTLEDETRTIGAGAGSTK